MARLTEIVGGRPRVRPGVLLGARRILAGMVAAGLVLPILALGGPPVYEAPLMCAAAGVIAVIVAATAWRWDSRRPAALTAAAGLAVIGCFLSAYVSYPGSGFVEAGLIGAGVGPLISRPLTGRLHLAIGFVTGLIALVLIRIVGDITDAALVLALLVAVTLVLSLQDHAAVGTAGSWTVSGIALAYGAFAVFWIGSTSPEVTWFGQLTWHGDRNANEVALTFDDGPNGQYTLDVARVLEQHGARGTFFFVGKAVAKEPEVVRQLAQEGNVIGNHSYNHGAFSYLDPTYPELTRTNQQIKQAAGVCPAFFRPPHGTHTPFMSRIASDAGMTLVTWDDSARDWVDNDPANVARIILQKVRPGSIIDLHDGSDGNIGVDRSVVAKALPMILDGLKAKGLKPVTLDTLLGKAPYTTNC